jgi:ABC-2 type transport system permease protein
MRHFLTILSHEIRMLLVSPSTYIAAVLFLGLMGFMFTTMLEDYSRGPQEISPAAAFFGVLPLPVLFMVPLLTMKSISEERRNGTLETLLTTPVTTFEVVLGKFGAAYFLYMLLWSSTAVFFYLLRRFAVDFDTGPLVGGYLFIAVSGLFFIGTGIFASSLSRNQSVAAILCFIMLFALLLGLNFVRDLAVLNHDAMAPVKLVVENIQVLEHLSDFSRGIVDARQLLFYLSGCVLCLIFSILGVEAKLIHS